MSTLKNNLIVLNVKKMACNRKQKIVSRKQDGMMIVAHRCINRAAPTFGRYIDDEICKVCPVRLAKLVELKPPRFPSIAKQLTNYGSAVARWIGAGRPTRTKGEVATCHSICTKCDWYDAGKCRGCGCKVSTNSFAVLNKIKMKTEHCPQRFW